MAKLNLTEEEKQRIIEAINSDAEPPAELMHKLFPNLAEQFDVATLDRAKIATLEYAGKRSEAAILNQTFPADGGSPLQIERCFEGGRLTGGTQLTLFDQTQKDDSGWQNLIVQGDNLQFLKTCYQNTDPLIKDQVKGKVKLVYIDPPFATKGDFSSKEGEDSYSDKIVRAEFIESLRERLIFIREILSEDGSIYVHLDQKMNHIIKIILDEIFGRDNFRNQIVWRNTNTHNKATTFGRIHQNILFYSNGKTPFFRKWKRPPFREYIEQNFSKGDDGIFNAKADLTASGIRFGESGKEWANYDPTTAGRHWAIPSFVYDLVDEDITSLPLLEKLNYLKNSGLIYCPEKEGGQPRILKPLDDNVGNFVMDIWAYQPYTKKIYTNNDDCIDNDVNWAIPKGENTGYPTQKPEGLLARIINSSSSKNDLVMDVFGGSGTVAAVAEKLGRRWITCDFGKHAIYTTQKRILRIAESKALGPDAGKTRKYEQGPKPFCVVSCGAYDFSRIMNLRENKEAYINFVLGLFRLPRDAKGFNDKYKLANIYGEKDGNPVEVYPVWDDNYLKNIRIDGAYLNTIIAQSGGRLRGDYYIITPETCTVTGDITLKNRAGVEVNFKMLKFPYKILEDVSRNFQIQEQPSAWENVNNLITATGFYFNNSVDIEVRKIKGGLKITKFRSGILDKNGEKYQGIEALAMLLVDVDYDDRIFDMETTVFAKDISDENEVKISGLTKSVAVIAIDKHGNESALFILKD